MPYLFRILALLAPPVALNSNHSPSLLICQLSAVTQSLNSLQIVYDKHYNISGGASPSPTKSESDSAVLVRVGAEG